MACKNLSPAGWSRERFSCTRCGDAVAPDLTPQPPLPRGEGEPEAPVAIRRDGGSGPVHRGVGGGRPGGVCSPAPDLTPQPPLPRGEGSQNGSRFVAVAPAQP